MAINKNFVVKNGLEVKSNLIVADGDTNKVGIGITVADYTLHVNGGIGATDVVVSSALTATTLNVGNLTVNGIGVTSLTVSGISTFTGAIDANGDLDVDGHTELDNLNVSGVSTFVGVGTFQGDLYVGGNLYVADDVFYDEVSGRNLNISGIGTIANLIVTTGTVSDLTSASIGSTNINISGVGTITTLDTTVGSIDYGTLVNLDVTGIGSIASLDVFDGTVDYLTSINLETTGITTLSSSGGITTAGGDLYSGGDLYFNGVLYQNGERYGIGIQTGDTLIGSGVTFIEFRGPGVSTGYYNSSSGIATVFFQGGGSGSIGIGSTFPGTPASIDPQPANGDLFFHIDYARTFIYYDEATLGVGSSAFWVDSAPFNVGIITALPGGVGFSAGSALSPSWYFEGDFTTGVFSPTNGELTFVSTGSSILNVNASGINVGTGVTVIGNVGDIAISGILTAASFVGDGSGLTGTGSTVADDTTTNSTFYPLFTTITSGTVTASNVSTTKLTYNPSTGTLTATEFNATSDTSLKENVNTVEGALDKVNNLRGVKFNWKDGGKASYGVIAQELEQILPELVSDTDPKTVNYNGIIGILIESVKELTARVEELENKSQ